MSRSPYHTPKRADSAIARLAARADLSFSEIARAAGVCPSNLTLISCGRSVSPRIALAIADVLTRRLPALREEVEMWLLSMGYTPVKLRGASPSLKRRILGVLHGQKEASA